MAFGTEIVTFFRHKPGRKGRRKHMDFKAQAVQELRDYRLKKQAIQRLEERMALLRQAGDTAGTEEIRILSRQHAAVSRLTALTEQCLAQLTPQQRLILHKFYIDRSPHHVEWLMEHLCVEQSQVYRRKEEALACFILGMYGSRSA